MSPQDSIDNISEVSDIDQLDGNISLCSDSGVIRAPYNYRGKNSLIARHLPVVSVCNVRSFFPKQNNWKNDFFEHQGDVSLLCEVWQKAEDKQHLQHLEHMLEMD